MDGHDIGQILPLWSVVPFVGMLASIALFPLAAPHIWHHHYPKIAIGWALLFAVPFLTAYGGVAWHEILHIYLLDYVPFIILLWGLFTVTGGIVVRGAIAGTPMGNTAMLLVGTLIASLTGTTGAAMLLIRPLLRANQERRHKAHIVIFFIFLVANIGGTLTPLGDPPLFLGFLHGVPFFWTLRLFPLLAVAAGILLLLFYLIDRTAYAREESAVRQSAGGPSARRTGPTLRVDGLINLLLLGGILGAVMQSGLWRLGSAHFGEIVIEGQSVLRDAGIVAMGLSSLWLTPRALRRDNGFSWGPMREVAWLFAGIFMTIIPALAILKAGKDGHLGFLIGAVSEPWHYFWVTGALSSFLDNAPTYLAFLNSELGRLYPGMPEAQAIKLLIAEHGLHLEAVAAGAVFMGANTYIGNAPNFMVKSIAENAGVRMPSFLGYVARWTVPVLLPIFLLVTWLFF